MKRLVGFMTILMLVLPACHAQNGKDDKVIRFCFAKKEETLLRAAERLIKI